MDKSNDIKQLREQIRKLDEQLDCEMQVLYPTKTHTLGSELMCQWATFTCLRLRRSWPGRKRVGRRRWSLWRTIASSWRRRWIMGTTRPCSNWRQRNNSEWRALTAHVPGISAAAGWFDSRGPALLRYHLVLQETNEERRTVANNLASVFTTAANHLSITEVPLSQLDHLIPAHTFVITLMWFLKNRSVWRICTAECSVSAPKLWKKTTLFYRTWRKPWRTLFPKQTACNYVCNADLSTERVKVFFVFVPMLILLFTHVSMMLVTCAGATRVH